MTTANSTSQSGQRTLGGMRTMAPGPQTLLAGFRKIRGASSFGPPTSAAWAP